jgi:hypothetical protein
MMPQASPIVLRVSKSLSNRGFDLGWNFAKSQVYHLF